MGFIKICQAVNISHEIRADLAERPILQRLPLIAFLEKKIVFNMQNPVRIISNNNSQWPQYLHFNKLEKSGMVIFAEAN